MIQNMSVADDEVLPAVQVIVKTFHPESQKLQIGAGDAGVIGRALENPAAEIVKDRLGLAGEVDDKQVYAPVVVIVADPDAHARSRPPLIV